MSGKKDYSGERERCPVHGRGRRLSRENIGEIRRWTDIQNSRARRKGLEPKEPKVTMFSCSCNCFHVDVE
ncbi:hypothetical protein PPSIR1_18762 [Plesiocystis pacifica SIR-1]|uniref:Uncharacterized protein n=1 Tax=Plesiocystis pacifica SIR-1 TaxID=391625 RepID=A6GBG8_9BACT|nr:hypothetical protein [Plesiocystis pacifica]EDM76772.1 hypothetical protein PPSIR1_18762 [Plesiocystis pacifica SIR-1]